MKWISFTIIAALTILCQTTIVPRMEIQSIWPDWMFILAVHYALWGRWPDVAIAAWILGFIVDLYSADRIGLHAFTYGAAAWGIVRLRQVVFRDHALTHVLMTFVFALAVQVLIGFYRWWSMPAGTSVFSFWWPAVFTAIYTAAWAPYLLWLYGRLGRWTGLLSRRRIPAYR